MFSVDATVGRSLGSDVAGIGIPALAAELYAFISSASKRKIVVLFIGTNDFGLSVDSAASFGTSYAALLDAIRSLNPAVGVICIPPMFRTNEATPNGFGDALAAYRTAIATAQSTRTWAVLVNSTPWLTPSDLADGLHPNAQGYAKVFGEVRALLGF